MNRKILLQPSFSPPNKINWIRAFIKTRIQLSPKMKDTFWININRPSTVPVTHGHTRNHTELCHVFAVKTAIRHRFSPVRDHQSRARQISLLENQLNIYWWNISGRALPDLNSTIIFERRCFDEVPQFHEAKRIDVDKWSLHACKKVP